jgi:hypothetical protein
MQTDGLLVRLCLKLDASHVPLLSRMVSTLQVMVCAALLRRGHHCVSGGRGAGVGGVTSSCVRLGVEGDVSWNAVNSMAVKRHSAAAASISSTQVRTAACV